MRKKIPEPNWDAVQRLMDDMDKHLKGNLVEVVRCRDCRYFAIVNQPYDQTWCGVMQDSVKPDGYCYKGEVRKDDTD